jgi:hypothetical protein
MAFVATGSSAFADDVSGGDKARQFVMRAGVAIFAAHHMIVVM